MNNQKLKVKSFRLCKRVTKENQVEHTLNNLKIKSEHFYNILKIGGLRQRHDMVHINHRKIQRLLNLTGTELYQVIRSMTGGGLYQERRGDSVKILQKTEEENTRTEKLLEELDRKISTLKLGKASWTEFDLKDRKVETIKRILYQRKEDLYQEKLSGAGGEIDKLIIQEKEFSVRVRDLEMEVQNQKSGIEANRLEEERRGQQERDLQAEEGIGNLDQVIKMEFETAKKRRKRATHNQGELHARLEEVEKEYNDKFGVKVRLEKKLEESKVLKMTQATPETQEVTNQRRQIASREHELRSQLKTYEKTEQELYRKKRLKRDAILKMERSIEEEISEMEVSKKKSERMRDEKYEMMVQENDIGSRLQSFKRKACSIKKNLRQYYGGVNVVSVLNIIEHVGRERMPGVIGVLAEVIEMETDGLPPVLESLYRDRLFTILVAEEKTVSELIRLNKKIKGGKIQICPLSWFAPRVLCSGLEISKEEQNRTMNTSLIQDFKESDNVMVSSLLKIKERYLTQSYSDALKVYFKDFFGKSAIVRDLKTAFSVAKSMGVDCITQNHEIVYKGGYHTKAGYHSRKHQSLDNFYMYQEVSEKTRMNLRLAEELKIKKAELGQQKGEVSKSLQNSQKKVLELKQMNDALIFGRLSNFGL